MSETIRQKQAQPDSLSVHPPDFTQPTDDTTPIVRYAFILGMALPVLAFVSMVMLRCPNCARRFEYFLLMKAIGYLPRPRAGVPDRCPNCGIALDRQT